MRKVRSVIVAVAALVVVGLAISARLAGHGQSREPAARAVRDHTTRATSAAMPAQPPREVTPAEPFPDGLVGTTAAQLIERIRKSNAKAVLVNAWATWCGPCKREVPMLLELQKKLEPQGVQLLLVSVDERANADSVLAFLKEQAAPLPGLVVSEPLGDFKRGIHPRWPGMLPASFLFDGSGKLRYFWGGEAFEHEVLPVVEGFLAGKAIDGEARFGLAPGRIDPPGE